MLPFLHRPKVALESSSVSIGKLVNQTFSEYLHHWIDLIFGYKQRVKERFVRFISSPEVLDRFVTIEKEIVQIEEGSIQSSERTNLVAAAEALRFFQWVLLLGW